MIPFGSTTTASPPSGAATAAMQPRRIDSCSIAVSMSSGKTLRPATMIASSPAPDHEELAAVHQPDVTVVK